MVGRRSIIHIIMVTESTTTDSDNSVRLVTNWGTSNGNQSPGYVQRETECFADIIKGQSIGYFLQQCTSRPAGKSHL